MSVDLRRALLDWLDSRRDFGPLGWRPAEVEAGWLSRSSALSERLAALRPPPGEIPTEPETAAPVEATRERPSSIPPAEPRAARELPELKPAQHAPPKTVTPSRAPAPRPAERAPATPVAERPAPPADWAGLRAAVAACTACSLAARRTQTVFGVGDERADLLIVGEAPGENEDLQGEPFVGRAGELLDKMLGAIGFAREDVYIANILKCRPPNNRDPNAEEVTCCRPFLEAQIALLQPKLVLALGRVAAKTLLGREATLGSLRGHVHEVGGRPMRASYHPAALLRNEHWKRPAWNDLLAARAHYDELGGRPGSLEEQRRLS